MHLTTRTFLITLGICLREQQRLKGITKLIAAAIVVNGFDSFARACVVRNESLVT